MMSCRTAPRHSTRGSGATPPATAYKAPASVFGTRNPPPSRLDPPGVTSHSAGAYRPSSTHHPSVEEDAGRFHLFLGEDVENTALEGEQILEHAGQRVGVLTVEFLEILEVVLVQQAPGLAVV